MTANPTPNLDLTATAMLVTLALLWGGSFFFAEIALELVAPLTVAAHRVFWAALLLVVWLYATGRRLPWDLRSWLAFLVMGAINNALPFCLIFWGQTTIDSGLAAVLNSTTAFFGVLVSALFLADERITAAKLIGTIVGIGGVLLITGIRVLDDVDTTSLAQFAVLGAAMSYALAGVWGRRYLSAMSPAVNATGMLIGSTALMIPIALVFDGPPIVALPATTWSALICLAVFSTAVAYLLYFCILSRAGAANLLLVTLLIPPTAMTLGTVFLGEVFGSTTLIGFAVIVIGLVITDGRVFDRIRRRFGRAGSIYRY